MTDSADLDGADNKTEDVSRVPELVWTVPAELMPKPDEAGNISDESILRAAKACLEKVYADLLLIHKYTEHMLSGISTEVAAALANLLEEARSAEESQDLEFSGLAKRLAKDAVDAVNRLGKKVQTSWRLGNTAEHAAEFATEESALIQLLREALGNLRVLKKQRESMPSGTEVGSKSVQPHTTLSKPAVQLSRSDFDTIRRSLYSTIESWLPGCEKSGNGNYLALNPFRDDKTKGSFVIYSDGRAHDFATGDSYDTIDIWTEVHKVTKAEAIKILAERKGLLPSASLLPAALPAPAPKFSPNVPPVGFPLPTADFFNDSRWGVPSRIYKYFDAEAKLIGFVARYDTPHLERKKQFCPVSFCLDSKGRPFWAKTTKGWNGSAPIYGIDRLKERPESPILIVEGEKVVDTAGILFPEHIIICWQGGSGNVAKADWKLLKGRKVDLIWPDADHQLDKKTGELLPLHLQPGMKAALTIAGTLSSQGSVPGIVVPKDGLNDGWDLADAVSEGWTPDKAQAYARANTRAPADILRVSEAALKPEAETASEDIRWKANDIAADMRKRFDAELESGTLESSFPFTSGFHNYAPSLGGSTREISPILVSVSEIGRVTIVPSEAFIDRFVRWYDSTGRLNYSKVNLSDDQMKTLALRLSLRLPTLSDEPQIFKRSVELGLAWHILDIDTGRWSNETAGIPDTLIEAHDFVLKLFEELCPAWHDQLSRMTNTMGFLCYLGSTLDLTAKPQQYLWLYGEGQDGKSTILKVLKRVFGASAIATEWPAGPNNFFTSRFEGRRLVLVDEEPGGTCVRTDLWKRLTGADTITIEPKGKQAYEIRNNLLIIVGSNFRPSTRARKADLRRLIICDLQTYHGTPDASFEDRLLCEFELFISVCLTLWHKFKGKSELAPVDQHMTRKNLDEISAELAEFLGDAFEFHDPERIKLALKDEHIPKKSIAHVPVSELMKICSTERIPYSEVKDHLSGVFGIPPQLIAYSRFEKKRVIFGIVPKPHIRNKFSLSEMTFRHLQAVNEADEAQQGAGV
jgi:hypothetical protein